MWWPAAKSRNSLSRASATCCACSTRGVGVDVGLTDLALRAVVAEEPVVAKGLRVPFPRQPHHLRRLPLEPLKLALTHLQTCRHCVHTSGPFLSRLTAAVVASL